MDSVTYDSTSFDGKPYRSERLYRPDLRTVCSTQKGGEVQVIKDHGDAHWTDAYLLCSEPVPHSDGSMMRYVVLLADGTGEHMVSQDRIRVKP